MQPERIHEDPDIYLITIPFTNVSTTATNCYIVKSRGEALVIDTGAPTDEGQELLARTLEELELDPAKTDFFLTHFHLDHAGLINAIRQSGARLYVSAAEYERTRLARKTELGKMMHDRFLAIGASQEEADTAQTIRIYDGDFVHDDHAFVFVDEGDEIAVGDYSLKVLNTAGHTAGHISLFEPDSGALFCGDHMLFVISPSIDYFETEQGSFEAYLENLKKIKELPVKLMLQSHGELRPDFNERIAWLINHHETRVEEVFRTVFESPGLSGIEAIKSTHWNVPVDTWEEIAPLQRSIIIVQGIVLLDHLTRTGRIEEINEEGKLLCYRAIESLAKCER